MTDSWLTIVSFLYVFPILYGFNILFLPTDISHSRSMALYAEKLALRGNFVKFWFINGGDSMITNVQNVSYESFPISMTQFKPNEIFYKVDKFLQKIHPVFNVRLVWAVNESLFSCYRLYFWHSHEVEKLKATRWDLIVSDEYPPNLCQRALSRSLSAPYVLWNTMLPPALFHDNIDIQHSPATYPTYSRSESSLKTFSQRLANSISHQCFASANRIVDLLISNSIFFHLFVTKGFAAESLLSFTQWPLDMDFIYPQSHRLIYSDLKCPMSKHLSSDWLEFVDRKDSNGTILLSLGHLLYWDLSLIQGLFSAAQKFSYFSFIWHLRVPQSLPHFNLKNVRIGSWLPLDDLLNHHKTLLLVNHAGAKSLIGGICARVPLLAIPHQFDQFRIGAKITELDIGQVMNKHTVTTEEIIGKVANIISQKKYRQNIEKMKQKMLDRITPSQGLLTFHLERAARRNSSLKLFHSFGGNLSTVNYYCFDVSFTFILIILIATVLTSHLNWNKPHERLVKIKKT